MTGWDFAGPIEILPKLPKNVTEMVESKKRQKRKEKPSSKGIDIFRFPLIGENPCINSKDYIYTGLDSKNMLIVRNLQDGTKVNEKKMKEMEKYYKALQNGKKCEKCSRIVVPEISDSNLSRASSSNVLPENGISLDFTVVVKDPKTGKSHPLNVVAKCHDGTPARVYINGKKFAPCSQ